MATTDDIFNETKDLKIGRTSLGNLKEQGYLPEMIGIGTGVGATAYVGTKYAKAKANVLKAIAEQEANLLKASGQVLSDPQGHSFYPTNIEEYRKQYLAEKKKVAAERTRQIQQEKRIEAAKKYGEVKPPVVKKPYTPQQQTKQEKAYRKTDPRRYVTAVENELQPILRSPPDVAARQKMLNDALNRLPVEAQEMALERAKQMKIFGQKAVGKPIVEAGANPWTTSAPEQVTPPRFSVAQEARGRVGELVRQKKIAPTAPKIFTDTLTPAELRQAAIGEAFPNFYRLVYGGKTPIPPSVSATSAPAGAVIEVVDPNTGRAFQTSVGEGTKAGAWVGNKTMPVVPPKLPAETFLTKAGRGLEKAGGKLGKGFLSPWVQVPLNVYLAGRTAYDIYNAPSGDNALETYLSKSAPLYEFNRPMADMGSEYAIAAAVESGKLTPEEAQRWVSASRVANSVMLGNYGQAIEAAMREYVLPAISK